MDEGQLRKLIGRDRRKRGAEDGKEGKDEVEKEEAARRPPEEPETAVAEKKIVARMLSSDLLCQHNR